MPILFERNPGLVARRRMLGWGLLALELALLVLACWLLPQAFAHEPTGIAAFFLGGVGASFAIAATLIALGPGSPLLRHCAGWGFAWIMLEVLLSGLPRQLNSIPLHDDDDAWRARCALSVIFLAWQTPLWCLRYFQGPLQFLPETPRRGSVSLFEHLLLMTEVTLAIGLAAKVAAELSPREKMMFWIMLGFFAACHALAIALLVLPPVLLIWRIRPCLPAAIGLLTMLAALVGAMAILSLSGRPGQQDVFALGLCGLAGAVLGLLPPLFVVRYFLEAKLPALWKDELAAKARDARKEVV